MPLSLQHRHAVLLADRTRDVRTITTVVTEVLAANPETTPLDIETALRAAFGQAYLVANSTTAGFEIVLGMQARDAALADAGDKRLISGIFSVRGYKIDFEHHLKSNN